MSRTFGFREWRTVAAIGCAVLVALVSQAVHAGAQLPCSAPTVFQGAAVNSFVLPYRYAGGYGSQELNLASRQISALVHFELLFSMLKYGAVGGTDLTAVPGQICDVDNVIAKVSRGSGPGVMQPGQTLVVVWGRLFEQGDQLYVQSYVRFLRQGGGKPVPEAISVKLAGAGFGLPLMAALPTQSLAFPPRRISKSDLATVAAEFAKTMVVRPSPNMSAKETSIDFSPERHFPYYVTKTTRTPEGDWMWIEPMLGGPAGWVRVRTAETPGKWSLQRWLPELAYVDAIHGFMRLRAHSGGDLGAKRKNDIQGWIDAGFARFEGAVPASEGPAAYGLARAVRGFAAWQLQPDAPANAAHLFAEARTFMPEYAGARNLAAVTRVLGTDGKLDVYGIDKLHRDLVSVVAIDPRNAFALGNLDRLYRTMSARPELSTLKPNELDERIAVVQAARLGAVEIQ